MRAKNTIESIPGMVYLWTIVFGMVVGRALGRANRRARRGGADWRHPGALLDHCNSMPKIVIFRSSVEGATSSASSLGLARDDYPGKKAARLQAVNSAAS